MSQLQEATCSLVAGAPKNFQTKGRPDNLVLIVRRIFSSEEPSSIDLNATVYSVPCKRTKKNKYNTNDLRTVFVMKTSECSCTGTVEYLVQTFFVVSMFSFTKSSSLLTGASTLGFNFYKIKTTFDALTFFGTDTLKNQETHFVCDGNEHC